MRTRITDIKIGIFMMLLLAALAALAACSNKDSAATAPVATETPFVVPTAPNPGLISSGSAGLLGLERLKTFPAELLPDSPRLSPDAAVDAWADFLTETRVVAGTDTLVQFCSDGTGTWLLADRGDSYRIGANFQWTISHTLGSRWNQPTMKIELDESIQVGNPSVLLIVFDLTTPEEDGTLRWANFGYTLGTVKLGDAIEVYETSECSAPSSGLTTRSTPTPVAATPTATPQPTATNVTPPGKSDGPTGELLVATVGIGELDGLLFNDRNGAFQFRFSFNQENLFWGGFDGNPMTEMLAINWSLDPSLESINFELRSGVKWNSPRAESSMDFGFFTADDYVQWFNLANAGVNPNSKHITRGQFARLYGPARKIGELEFEIELLEPIFVHNNLSAFKWVYAGPDFVRGIEMMGEEWTEANPVGTGPFVMGECNSERCSGHAVPDHWRKTPEFETLTVIAFGREGILPALENGVVDICMCGTGDVPDPFNLPGGFRPVHYGAHQGQSIAWPGNLWEENHAGTGEPLNPWDSPPYDTDLPWIGDPWQQIAPDKVRYVDTDNPPGMTDMEQARLVRLALSIAVDRESLIEDVLAGYGIPLYSEYMGPEYSGWDASRETTNWSFDGHELALEGTRQPVPWQLPDGDLAEADRLLTLAGYPLVDGVRQGFEQEIYLYPGGFGEVGGPANYFSTRYILDVWASLGVPVADLENDPGKRIGEYRGVIGPRAGSRELFLPVLKNGQGYTNLMPLDSPPPSFDTSFSRVGGIGFESPFLSSQRKLIYGEADKSVRETEHLRVVDYMLFWQLYSGVFQVPMNVLASDRIASWNAPSYDQEGVGWGQWPEYIVLND